MTLQDWYDFCPEADRKEVRRTVAYFQKEYPTDPDLAERHIRACLDHKAMTEALS